MSPCPLFLPKGLAFEWVGAVRVPTSQQDQKAGTEIDQREQPSPPFILPHVDPLVATSTLEIFLPLSQHDMAERDRRDRHGRIDPCQNRGEETATRLEHTFMPLSSTTTH